MANSNSNFCSLNDNAQVSAGTISTYGLLFKHTSTAWRTSIGTFAVSTGKWYWEACQPSDRSGNGFPIGVYDLSDGKFTDVQEANYPGQAISTYGTSYAIYSYGNSTRSAYQHNGTETNFQDLGTGTTGDIWQCALDLDNGKLFFGKNNTWDNSANPATGTNPISSTITTTSQGGWTPITCSYNGTSSEVYIQNFGQDSFFGSNKSTGTANAADENGFGDFYYAPPAGFLALCSNNLPTSSDIDPAETNDDIPIKNFGVVTYSGTGSTQAITGLGFKPDAVFIKGRNDTTDHRLVNSSIGVGKALRSNTTGGDVSEANGVTAFGTDGFTVGSETGYNGSTINFVAWCWRANGGVTSTDTNGTITSTVQANTAGGFSIVQYTGNGSDGASIGHGLGASPECIWVKNRDAADSWAVYHVSTGNASHLLLDSGTGVTTSSAYWNSFTPSSTIFKVGTDHKMNANTEKYVAYCWSGVEGYSKFGKYIGNGNADGPFVYTGFRPKFFWIKRTDGSHYWYILDRARSTIGNPVTQLLNWDGTIAEGTHGTSNNIDFLSNGWKMRTSGGSLNGDGGNFIWAAFGDVPFKYRNPV